MTDTFKNTTETRHDGLIRRLYEARESFAEKVVTYGLGKVESYTTASGNGKLFIEGVLGVEFKEEISIVRDENGSVTSAYGLYVDEVADHVLMATRELN